jgi:hypothetical protein
MCGDRVHLVNYVLIIRFHFQNYFLDFVKTPFAYAALLKDPSPQRIALNK